MDKRKRNPLSIAGTHLDLIKVRLLHLAPLVRRLSKQPLSTQFVVELDHAYLDIRKVIEELMLLSVCAHDFASIELSNDLRKEWNAEQLVRKLERVNPRFYPEAIEIKPSEEPGIDGYFVASSEDCLTRQEAIDIYNLCGSVLHASNKHPDAKVIARRLASAQTFVTKILNLLKCFEIDLSGQRITVLGQLRFSEPELPPELFYAPVSSGRT